MPALSPFNSFALHSCHVPLFRSFLVKNSAVSHISFHFCFAHSCLVSLLAHRSQVKNRKWSRKCIPACASKMEIWILIRIRHFPFDSFWISKHNLFILAFAQLILSLLACHCVIILYLKTFFSIPVRTYKNNSLCNNCIMIALKVRVKWAKTWTEGETLKFSREL